MEDALIDYLRSILSCRFLLGSTSDTGSLDRSSYRIGKEPSEFAWIGDRQRKEEERPDLRPRWNSKLLPPKFKPPKFST